MLTATLTADVVMPASSKTNQPTIKRKDALRNAEYSLPVDMKPAAKPLPIP